MELIRLFMVLWALLFGAAVAIVIVPPVVEVSRRFVHRLFAKLEEDDHAG